jgi:hypothetical protein
VRAGPRLSSRAASPTRGSAKPDRAAGPDLWTIAITSLSPRSSVSPAHRGYQCGVRRIERPVSSGAEGMERTGKPAAAGRCEAENRGTRCAGGAALDCYDGLNERTGRCCASAYAQSRRARFRLKNHCCRPMRTTGTSYNPPVRRASAKGPWGAQKSAASSRGDAAHVHGFARVTAATSADRRLGRMDPVAYCHPGPARHTLHSLPGARW